VKLPNAHLTLVEEAKVLDYLLNAAHPDNGGKAAFFLGLGFSRTRWQDLANALKNVAGTAEISKNMETPHGVKYILEGQIKSTSGKTAMVRTIWVVDRGEVAPRLVTAYPFQQ
jgi:hypothetical protein